MTTTIVYVTVPVVVTDDIATGIDLGDDGDPGPWGDACTWDPERETHDWHDAGRLADVAREYVEARVMAGEQALSERTWTDESDEAKGEAR